MLEDHFTRTCLSQARNGQGCRGFRGAGVSEVCVRCRIGWIYLYIYSSYMFCCEGGTVGVRLPRLLLSRKNIRKRRRQESRLHLTVRHLDRTSNRRTAVSPNVIVHHISSLFGEVYCDNVFGGCLPWNGLVLVPCFCEFSKTPCSWG